MKSLYWTIKKKEYSDIISMKNVFGLIKYMNKILRINEDQRFWLPLLLSISHTCKVDLLVVIKEGLDLRKYSYKVRNHNIWDRMKYRRMEHIFDNYEYGYFNWKTYHIYVMKVPNNT